MSYLTEKDKLEKELASAINLKNQHEEQRKVII